MVSAWWQMSITCIAVIDVLFSWRSAANISLIIAIKCYFKGNSRMLHESWHPFAAKLAPTSAGLSPTNAVYESFIILNMTFCWHCFLKYTISFQTSSFSHLHASCLPAATHLPQDFITCLSTFSHQNGPRLLYFHFIRKLLIGQRRGFSSGVSSACIICMHVWEHSRSFQESSLCPQPDHRSSCEQPCLVHVPKCGRWYFIAFCSFVCIHYFNF